MQVKTDGIVLNESASQPEELNQMIKSSHNENMNQINVEIEQSS